MKDATVKGNSKIPPSEAVTASSRVDDQQCEPLESLEQKLHRLRHEVLPTLCTIIPRLPISLVAFALSMFVLVQALTDKGWIQVFSNWWDAWINVCGRSGTGGAVIGAVAGMLFISTVLCNVSGHLSSFLHEEKNYN